MVLLALRIPRGRLGAGRDGTLLAIDVRIEQQIGAYSLGGESSDVPGFYQTMYRCANVSTEQLLVYANTGPASARRSRNGDNRVVQIHVFIVILARSPLGAA